MPNEDRPDLTLFLDILRTLEEIRADILAVEKEAEGMLAEIIGESTQ